MGAQEEQGEGFVLVLSMFVAGRRRDKFVTRHLRRGGLLTPPACLFAAHLVGQPARSNRYQPALRILGDTLRRPLDGGGEQRFLHRVLSQVEIAVTPDERAENPRRELAQQVLDSASGSRHHISVPASSMIGRTSTPQNRAAGS